MDLRALDAILRQAIKKDGSLEFTGLLVNSAVIAALISRVFPDGVLRLTRADVSLDSNGQILTVAGKTDLGVEIDGVLPVIAAPVTITLTLNAAQALEMVCAIRLPNGWMMSQLFEVLPDDSVKALVVHDTRLLLTTSPYTDPVSGHVLAPGLNLSGKLQIAPTYPHLGAVLNRASEVAISGPIADFYLPLFEFTTDELAGTLLDVPISGVRLCPAVVNIAPATLTPIALGQTKLVAALTVADKPGMLTATLPANASSVAISVDFPNLSLADFTPVRKFIGDIDPFIALPDPVRTKIVGAFKLRHLGLAFDLERPAFRSADLAVAVDLQEFEIFRVIPALKVKELALALRVDHGGETTTVTFGAQTEIQIGSRYAVVLSFQTQFAGAYVITVAQKPGTVLPLTEVLGTFAPGLAASFPKLDVQMFSLVLRPATDDTAASYTFDAVIAASSPWPVVTSPELTLTEIDISVAYNGGLDHPLSGVVKGRLTLRVDDHPENDVLITLAAERAPGATAWELSGNTGPDQEIPVGHLVDAIIAKFDATLHVPQVVSDVTIQNLSLTFNTESKAFHFGALIRLPFNDEIVLELTASIDVTKTAAGFEATFRATFLVLGYRFHVVFDKKAAASNTLIATYSPAKGGSQSVRLKDLLGAISPTLEKDVPADIAIDLKDVKFVFYAAKPNKLAFGLDVGIPIDLSKIPVVGNKLPKDFSLEISNLQGVYATKPFDATEIGAVNALLPGDIVSFPKDGLRQGMNLSGEVSIGTTTKDFVLAGAGPKKLAAAAGADDTYKWIDINKQIGIFQFNRAGAGYQDNVFSLAMDAGVSLGPLSFTMDGLSVGSPLGKFDPTFSLNGLGLAFSRPPLTLSGNFLKVKEPTGTSYYGQVAARFKQFGFSALGGWSPDASPPSFFLYASVNVPLGGPPFLFVTGLAAGLGINRTLLLPTIDDLPGYILLPGKAPEPKGTPSETVAKILPQLQKYFQVNPGQFWVAAGLRFSSFEMVDSFVLVTVAFGVDLQFAVLGTSAMSLPSGTDKPVAYVAVDLIASYTPSAGLLAVDGRLSPQSFLFGGFVKLSGGFAFYVWFAGEHAGDFVISIGGYYPSFKVDHYPVVPRLRIEFSLGPLSVTGSAYFALTPSMLMAGLSMSAVWKSGPIKAWLDARLDFLIAWAPFHYETQVYIGLGVSVEIGLFVLSVQIGADMFVWGPPFGGRARIDLDVVSFTIEFGDPPLPAPPIGWTAFKTNFLPKNSTAAAPVMAAALTPQPVTGSNIIKAQVNAGLQSTAVPGYDWIVEANWFDIITTSAIPANAATWAQPNHQAFTIPIAVSAYNATARRGSARTCNSRTSRTTRIPRPRSGIQPSISDR